MNGVNNMITQIRADLYRQRHSAGTLITVVLSIIYATLIIWNKAAGGISINTESSHSSLDQLVNKSWSVLDSVHAATLSSTVLLYLLIAIFTIVIGCEFSQHVYKNTLVSGISRLQFILAKYITLLINICGLLLIYYLTTIAVALVAGRQLGTPLNHLIRDTITTLLTTAFFVSVIFSLAILLLIISKSVVASTVLIILWPILISTVRIFSGWRWLNYVDFFGAANRIAFGTIKDSQLPSYILVSVGTLIVSILGAAVLIHEQEL